jgi:transcriptional regulator with PAS, ATPase and Fis domain
LLEDQRSTNGTYVFGARVESAEIDEATVVTLGATGLVVNPVEAVPDGTQRFIDAAALKSRPRGIATIVPIVEQQMPRLVRIAMAKLPILLLGESGAGKEVLARTVHEVSARTGPFVAINCGALAPSLVESQLFGYVRGAFSGATRDEPGLVRASSGGTLFLDEIGELPAAAQATLLRVLQEKEVLPLGATKPIPVDLRVVAATLKPIEQSPMFRPDLYARVAAYVHRLVPLRERRADLGLLIADLLPRLAAERASKLRISPDLVTALVSHSWPLNVRELEHVLSVAIVTSTEDLLRIEHVGDALRAARISAPPAAPLPASASASAPASAPSSTTTSTATTTNAAARVLTEEDEKLRAELFAELTRTHGNVSEVARTMGKTRMQIHRWMKRFGITPESFRG